MSFFIELKRRNVYKVAVAYGVVGWLLVQAASILLPTFEAPSWMMKAFVVFLVIGFVISVMISWAFEATPEGLKRTANVSPDAVLPTWSARRFAAFVLIVALIAAGLLAYQFTQKRNKQSELPPISTKSIAILPFDNLSDDKANGYFVDGMQDEIITRLANIGALRVISRSSTQRYKATPTDLSEIAKQLGVTHFLEGSVQKAGERVRINVQLIRAGANDHLWAQVFDRQLTDIFAVESEVASAIASSLQAKLTKPEQEAVEQKPTENLDAYDAYLRGVNLLKTPAGSGTAAAADFFSEAVRLDPSFALAWARLSEVNAVLYFNQLDATPARKEAARAATEMATKLRPDAPAAILASAYYRYHVLRDYEGARIQFEQLHRKVPSNSEALTALAFIARRQSRWTDAIKYFQEAAQLNPRDPDLLNEWSWTLGLTRQFADARRIIDRGLEVRPNDTILLANKATTYQAEADLPGAAAVLRKLNYISSPEPVLFAQISQYLLERDYVAAIKFIQKALSEAGPKPAFTFSMARLSLAQAQELAGDKAEAKANYSQARNELEVFRRDQPDNAWIACGVADADAGLGNKEAALREGEHSITLLPADKDPVMGPGIEELIARVEARLGEPNRAIPRIERLLAIPYGPGPITPALLRLDPGWDSIRNDPRFQKLSWGKP